MGSDPWAAEEVYGLTVQILATLGVDYPILLPMGTAMMWWFRAVDGRSASKAGFPATSGCSPYHSGDSILADIEKDHTSRSSRLEVQGILLK